MTTKDKTSKATPRQGLDTVGGLIAEASRVYRMMCKGTIEHGDGRSRVWVLSQIRGMVETQALERLEQRLEELAPAIEGKRNGYTGADRQSSYTH